MFQARSTSAPGTLHPQLQQQSGSQNQYQSGVSGQSMARSTSTGGISSGAHQLPPAYPQLQHQLQEKQQPRYTQQQQQQQQQQLIPQQYWVPPGAAAQRLQQQQQQVQSFGGGQPEEPEVMDEQFMDVLSAFLDPPSSAPPGQRQMDPFKQQQQQQQQQARLPPSSAPPSINPFGRPAPLQAAPAAVAPLRPLQEMQQLEAYSAIRPQPISRVSQQHQQQGGGQPPPPIAAPPHPLSYMGLGTGQVSRMQPPSQQPIPPLLAQKPPPPPPPVPQQAPPPISASPFAQGVASSTGGTGGTPPVPLTAPQRQVSLAMRSHSMLFSQAHPTSTHVGSSSLASPLLIQPFWLHTNLPLDASFDCLPHAPL